MYDDTVGSLDWLTDSLFFVASHETWLEFWCFKSWLWLTESKVCFVQASTLGAPSVGYFSQMHQGHQVVPAVCLPWSISTMSNAQQLPLGACVQTLWDRSFPRAQKAASWGDDVKGDMVIMSTLPFYVGGHSDWFGYGPIKQHGKCLAPDLWMPYLEC